MSNYWLAEPFVVSVNDAWKIVAVPVRLRDKYRDYLNDCGIVYWEERADMRPGFIEFGYEESNSVTIKWIGVQATNDEITWLVTVDFDAT